MEEETFSPVDSHEEAVSQENIYPSFIFESIPVECNIKSECGDDYIAMPGTTVNNEASFSVNDSQCDIVNPIVDIKSESPVYDFNERLPESNNLEDISMVHFNVIENAQLPCTVKKEANHENDHALKKESDSDFGHTEDSVFPFISCGARYQEQHKIVCKNEQQSDSDLRYDCEYYDKKFLNEYDLNNHGTHYSGSASFTCQQCYKNFSRKDNLNTHLKTVHNKEKKFECDLCKKMFTRSDTLNSHKRTHTNEKPFSCSICDKNFSKPRYLTVHMRAHTGERPYACITCNKKFPQASDLTAHLRIHTGDRPYSCSVCNKTFTHSSNLSKHMRIHTGEKPYSCTICKKMFTDSCDLNVHMRSHTGETPYSCNYCGMKFVYLYSMKKHLKKNHNNII